MRALSVLLSVVLANAAIAAPVEGPNGNFYEFIANSGLTGPEAFDDAETHSFEGATGHLVTITSEEENSFVSGLTTAGEFWIGASDSELEGTWKWITGPESGTVFWQNGTSLGYENWHPPNEPNNFPHNAEGEDYVALNTMTTTWNDLPNPWHNTPGYVVEFEASEIPEPASLAIIAVGVITLLRRRMA